MHKGAVLHYVAKAMVMGSAIFLVPALVSLLYKEWTTAAVFFGVAVAILMLFGVLAMYKPKTTRIFSRESMAIAAILWILLSVAGAFPFFLTGYLPNFIDALFESVSGFTTTSFTVISDVEDLPHGLLFFRSFSAWIGGVGVLVLIIAILPSSTDAMSLMRAEASGAGAGKLVPQGRKTAMYIVAIYVTLTVLCMVLLLFGGMPLFDAVCNAMCATATGGFSVRNAGVAAYDSAYIEGVLIAFMMLSSISYAMYYCLLTRNFKAVYHATEWKSFLLAFILGTGLTMLLRADSLSDILPQFRTSVFNVASAMTTTGYTTSDLSTWPLMCQIILLLFMMIGGCSGSTAGGLKVQRLALLLKSARVSLRKSQYANSVHVVKNDGKAVSTEITHSVMRYLVLMLCVEVTSILLVSFQNLDMTTTISSVVSCFSNAGIAFGEAVTDGTFNMWSHWAKFIFILDMLLGRLEIIPIFLLCTPSAWRQDF